ncbi:Uncharacterized [Moorella glycerini]|nr:Uncharacterized [Moorella glycerini]CEP66350.1 Uncharacterized [Moorella glycerini]
MERVEDDGGRDLAVGSTLTVRAWIFLGALQPSDVKVEIYHGPLDAGGEIIAGEKETMNLVQETGEGRYLYSGVIFCRRAGRQGYNVRVLPCHVDLAHPFQTGLILWG